LSVALVARVPGGKGGRVVEDFVSLPDLAPTFMEVGGVTPPADLYGRSLKAQLQSDKSGQIDPERNWVIGGRERHVATAREDNLPYPMRCLRTPEFLYIRNFAPDRWPMGAPYSATATGSPPAEELEKNTFVAYPDMDASPTKAWLILHQNEPQWKWHFDRAFGKRPAEELYDLRKDPDQTQNVAADPAYAAQQEKLAADLMKKLKEAADPRVTGGGLTFDQSPFTDAVTD
jgi:N-sulfoglucosamine sulfohydrolase